MHLTGIHNFELVYVLVDTPEKLINKEAYYYCERTGYDWNDIIVEFERNHTFGDIPIEERVKVFKFAYDLQIIEKLKEQVIKCRKQIELWKE